MSLATTTRNAPAGAPEHHLPGEAGVWVLILGDMLMFAIFFATFAYYRAQDVAGFAQSQQMLNKDYGIVNTLLLLTSSLFVVLAVRRARSGQARRVPALFALAGICGLGFMTLKFIEYREKLATGISLLTNDFFMFYFALTGLHAIHVLLGLGVLSYLHVISRTGAFTKEKLAALESGASFWHMVDILWIVLFPLLYLMK